MSCLSGVGVNVMFIWSWCQCYVYLELVSMTCSVACLKAKHFKIDLPLQTTYTRICEMECCQL